MQGNYNQNRESVTDKQSVILINKHYLFIYLCIYLFIHLFIYLFIYFPFIVYCIYSRIITIYVFLFCYIALFLIYIYIFMYLFIFVNFVFTSFIRLQLIISTALTRVSALMTFPPPEVVAS